MLSAAAVIRLLDLKPHPEGGHYREIFRDPRTDDSGRAASTAIYFLLKRGERSHWHRVDAAETWHWYAGSALVLRVGAGGITQSIRLGIDLYAGDRPQAVVPTYYAAAQWRLASNSRDLNWRRTTGTRDELISCCADR